MTRPERELSRRTAATLLAGFPLFEAVLWGAVRGDEVLYVGGTVQDVPEATKGELNTGDPEHLIFSSEAGGFRIPYKRITSLEYGQKAGRRVGVAIAITVWALFSKKRKHFLTIGYDDEDGQRQGVVLEIGKKNVKKTIVVIEVRSGQEVEYESEEARKHVHG